MDKTTKWLIRITCLAILGGGIGAATYFSLKEKNEIEKIANSCPPGHGYLGGGLCQFIGYFRGSIDGYGWRGDSRLLGKGWPDKRTWAGIRKPPQFLKRATPVKASFDKRCPLVEPEIGRNNSCQNGTKEAPKDQRIIVPLQGSMD